MRRDRYDPYSLFDAVPQLALRFEPELAAVDRLLEDDVLFRLVRDDLVRRYPRSGVTGRPSTPVEVVLRMLVVKHLHGWSDEQTERFVADSLVPRQFCRLALEPVPHLGQTRVGTAVHRVNGRLPVPPRRLHTDDGGGFLNRLLVPWWRAEGIRCTRGRPDRKNDQAWAERRNWTAVRQLVGYDRYSSTAAPAQLGGLCPLVRDDLNVFQPVRTLLGKQRDGSKLTKRYDAAATPYRRLLPIPT